MLLGLAGLSGCGREPAAAAPAAPPPLPVTVIVAAPQNLPLLFEAVGRAEGSKQVDVRARVSGILEHTVYKEGEFVRAGATLFQIDRQPLQIALDQARAAQAQDDARLEHAEREAARLKDLAADHSISAREYDDADAAAKTARGAANAAAARVRDAQLNLSYATVTAPISGITGSVARSDGSLVTASTDSALLTTMLQTDPIWIRFALSDAEFARLRANGGNAEVRLVLADGSRHEGHGRINFKASAVDDRLGTVQLRAQFANPKLAILPGQYVRAQVFSGTQQGVVVPQVAVVQNDRGRFVWIAGADGKASLKPVTVGNWIGHDWLVYTGLAAGDQVIVDNLLKLRPGAAVQAKPAGDGAATPPAPPAPASAPPAKAS